MQNATLPTRKVIALVVFALAMFGAGMCTMGAMSALQTNAAVAPADVLTDQPACVDSGKGFFNECAVLDLSRIDDLRTDAEKVEELHVAEGGRLIASDAN